MTPRKLLAALAPFEPMTDDDTFNCVHCGSRPPPDAPKASHSDYYAGRYLSDHESGCPWVKARRLLGDKLPAAREPVPTAPPRRFMDARMLSDIREFAEAMLRVQPSVSQKTTNPVSGNGRDQAEIPEPRGTNAAQRLLGAAMNPPKKRKVCTHDNPATRRREQWVDGKLMTWSSFAGSDAWRDAFLPPWKDNQIIGDLAAMKRESTASSL